MTKNLRISIIINFILILLLLFILPWKRHFDFLHGLWQLPIYIFNPKYSREDTLSVGHVLGQKHLIIVNFLLLFILMVFRNIFRKTIEYLSPLSNLILSFYVDQSGLGLPPLGKY